MRFSKTPWTRAICTIDGGYLEREQRGNGGSEPESSAPKRCKPPPSPGATPSVEYVPVNRQTALRYLATELYGLGALDLLLEEGQRAGTITDIYVNSPCDIWMGINGTTRPVALSLGTERRVREPLSGSSAGTAGGWMPRIRRLTLATSTAGASMRLSRR